MKSKILGLLAMGLLLVTATANAVMVTVDGVTLNVTTTTGTVTALQDLLDDQIWWDNVPKAADWAVAVGGSLGYPNSVGSGPNESPFFAFSLINFAASNTESPVHGIGFASPPNTPYTFAVAESVAAPVPLPAAAWLLLSGLGGLGFLGRRRAVS